MNLQRIIVWLPAMAMAVAAWAQDAHVMGHVDDERGEHMHYVTVQVKGTTLGTLSDETGHYFLKDLPVGRQTLAFSCVGYVTEERTVELRHGQMLELNVRLREQTLLMDDVVVTANKYATKRKESAAIVNVIPPVLFEATSAHCMADVLGFQTGLRVEQTCTNCGVTELRINGMDGQYSQVLMDSRPIFSSLASVYGLEQVPAGMVDRVEVIRGGGSALYGANAIAGVVNIITKEPTRNFVNVDHSMSYLETGATDANTAMNASVVTEGRQAGLFLFAVQRNRSQYDRDGDGYSDIPLLSSTTAGFRSFFRMAARSRLTAEYHHVAEHRRGGCDVQLPPHETDLAEQLRHAIDAGQLRWDAYSADERHYVQLYASVQNTACDSYFGTGRNPDAYGRTGNVTAVGGVQYRLSYPSWRSMQGDLSAGAEYSYDRLHDRLLGYGRDMVQRVSVGGAYVQNEWKSETLSLLLGARLERHNLLSGAVFSPRANLRYTPHRDVILRLTYASGYRAPQAYDEDLHVSAVGGEVALISLTPGLRPEYSHSLSGSADLYRHLGPWEANLTLEGFYTRLDHAFALVAEGHDAQGNLQMTRVNSDGAYVAGVNLEAKVAYRRLLLLQGGYTLQRSRYKADFAWSESPDIAPQRRMFRTPGSYGYFLAQLTPRRGLAIAADGKLTGPMLVQHFAGYVAADVETLTGHFAELGLKVSREIPLYGHYTLELSGGVKNLLDQYQPDLDKGMERDAAYIYGPALPRTWFLGLSLKI